MFRGGVQTPGVQTPWQAYHSFAVETVCASIPAEGWSRHLANSRPLPFVSGVDRPCSNGVHEAAYRFVR